MATTTNFGWETPDDTDLVKDGAAAIRTALGGVDTSFVDLKGGTTGQVLSKATNTDLDFTWVTQDDANAIQNTIVDAKGDIIAATANDTPARLAVGTNGHVLTADSTAATGLKWAAAPTGGKVLQVVNATYSTEFATSSSTYGDTGLTATITPTLATSKILVMVTHFVAKTGQYTEGAIQLLRGASSILTVASLNLIYNGENINVRHSGVAINYLDSPATTSATTYKTQAKSVGATSTFYTNISSSGASTITLIEIGA